MYFKKIFPSLFMVFAATILSAAEPETKPRTAAPDKAAATIPVESDEPVMPKRELKFDVSEEEVPLPLENVQEGMLDQRYVAAFRLVFTKKEKPAENPSGGAMRGMRGTMRDRSGRIYANPSNVIGLADESAFPLNRSDTQRILTSQVYEHFHELSVYQDTLLLGGPGFQQIQKEFFLSKISSEDPRISRDEDPRISRDIDAGSDRRDLRVGRLLDHGISQRAKATAIAFLKQTNALFIESNVSNDQAGNPVFDQIHLLSPTAEEAKEFVLAWFTVYDWGLCYPAQTECLDIKKKLVEMLAENSDKLEKAETDLGNAKQEVEKYKEFADITPEAIVTLTTQRRMLAVDLAGIKARIDACREMLAKENISAARKDQIETTRVNAEIELRGLNAKQSEIDGIIQGAQTRQKFLRTIQQSPMSIQHFKSLVYETQKAIKEIEEYQLGYQSLPIEDGNVTIRRIKWISPSKTEKSKPDSPSAPR
jgi:hypothetical protein